MVTAVPASPSVPALESDGLNFMYVCYRKLCTVDVLSASADCRSLSASADCRSLSASADCRSQWLCILGK